MTCSDCTQSAETLHHRCHIPRSAADLTAVLFQLLDQAAGCGTQCEHNFTGSLRLCHAHHHQVIVPSRQSNTRSMSAGMVDERCVQLWSTSGVTTEIRGYRLICAREALGLSLVSLSSSTAMYSTLTLRRIRSSNIAIGIRVFVWHSLSTYAVCSCTNSSFLCRRPPRVRLVSALPIPPVVAVVLFSVASVS